MRSLRRNWTVLLSIPVIALLSVALNACTGPELCYSLVNGQLLGSYSGEVECRLVQNLELSYYNSKIAPPPTPQTPAPTEKKQQQAEEQAEQQQQAQEGEAGPAAPDA